MINKKNIKIRNRIKNGKENEAGKWQNITHYVQPF